MHSKQDLYKSILYHAADVYGIDYDDIERDFAQQFDPVIRFMSGALASELERVYQQIHDTDSRLQKRLAQVLLPEHFHLPRPAHALASATASSDPVLIDEKTEFRLEADEDLQDVAFSPVFPSRILPVQIEWIATDSELRKGTVKGRRGSKMKENTVYSTRRIAIGFSATDPIINWNKVGLYFNLKPIGKTTADQDQLFAALTNATCTLHEHSLSCFRGLPIDEHDLEEYLDETDRMEKLICNRYDRQFLSFQGEEIADTEPVKAIDFLQRWFEESLVTAEDVEQRTNTLKDQAETPFYWLIIHLSRPISAPQLLKRLQVAFNVFPVVNRRLNGHRKGEHHYLRGNSIKWISLQPQEDFAGIQSVYGGKPPNYQTFLYKPFAEFRGDRSPSFTLRFGGIGRWDDFNAWERLSYLVSILEDNHKQHELVSQAAKGLSLEDIHHLLGDKIKLEKDEQRPTRDIYVLLHMGVASNMRVRIEYWTSIGAAANGLPVKAELTCISKHKSSLESLSLVTAPEGGRNPLNASEQLDAMREVLLSRSRIVTREDVRIFCINFLKDRCDGVEINDGVGIDPRPEFGMTRVIEVKLTPSSNARKEDWQGICNQLKRLLDEKSSSNIPFMVTYSSK